MKRYKKATRYGMRRHKASKDQGKAVMLGPMGWVIDTGAGEPKVVNDGYNYLGHTPGKNENRTTWDIF